jgi:hypothetical protein
MFCSCNECNNNLIDNNSYRITLRLGSLSRGLITYFVSISLSLVVILDSISLGFGVINHLKGGAKGQPGLPSPAVNTNLVYIYSVVTIFVINTFGVNYCVVPLYCSYSLN